MYKCTTWLPNVQSKTFRLRKFKPGIQHSLGGGWNLFDFRVAILDFEVTTVIRPFLQVFSNPVRPIHFGLCTTHFHGVDITDLIVRQPSWISRSLRSKRSHVKGRWSVSGNFPQSCGPINFQPGIHITSWVRHRTQVTGVTNVTQIEGHRSVSRCFLQNCLDYRLQSRWTLLPT